MAANDTQVSVDSLAQTGAHFAHVKSRRHPSMKKFILGTKQKVDLINLEETKEMLDKATSAVERYGAEGKTVLFVAGKREALKATKAVAERLSMPYVAGRWLGGTITNFGEIKKRLDRLSTLQGERESGELEKKYTKLERLMLSREENRLRDRMGGLLGMTKTPDLVVIVDTGAEHIAVAEAKAKNIPVVGLMSSDCDLADAMYPIVANDASIKTVTLILEELANAYAKGRDGAS